jgi:flagellar motility protein MotE (MotC chaperone)
MDDDIAALQQRIQALTKALSETRQDSTSLDSLITTFSQMPATESSLILKKLMVTNQKRAISILAGMANDKRAQVLAEIAKVDDQMAAKITNELLQ